MPYNAAAAVVEFIYSRLRGNSSDLPVVPMPMGPKDPFPTYAFSVQPLSAPAREQGGDVIVSYFQAVVVVVGKPNGNDLEPLKFAAQEAGNNLRTNSHAQGNTFGTGTVLSCMVAFDVCLCDRDPQGVLHWQLGQAWNITVQPV